MILKLSSRDIKSLTACFLVLGVLVYVYEGPFKKYKELFNEKTNVIDRLKNIDKQLDNFRETKIKVAEQEQRINEISLLYKDFLVSNAELINEYKGKVINVLKQYEVYEFKESIKSLQDNNADIRMEFSFSAPYDRLYRILFDMEKFSVISKFECGVNGVVIECGPYLHSSNLNDYFLGRQTQNINDIMKKGLFYEVADRVITSVNVGYIPTIKDLLPTPRNPFVKAAEKAAPKETVVKTNVPREVVRTLPAFQLDGILYDQDNPVAIIEGNLYHVGGVYKKEIKIKKISPNSIEVEYYGKIYKIKMLN